MLITEIKHNVLVVEWMGKYFDSVKELTEGQSPKKGPTFLGFKLLRAKPSSLMRDFRGYT